MVHFDCTAMWVRNSRSLHRTFNVDPLYLQHENSGLAIDYMVRDEGSRWRCKKQRMELETNFKYSKKVLNEKNLCPLYKKVFLFLSTGRSP